MISKPVTLPSVTTFQVLEQIAVDLPDPIGTNPVPQRVAIRGGTTSGVDDYDSPPFYNYPNTPFFTTIVKPAFLYHALVEMKDLEVQFLPAFQVGSINQSSLTYQTITTYDSADWQNQINLHGYSGVKTFPLTQGCTVRVSPSSMARQLGVPNKLLGTVANTLATADYTTPVNVVFQFAPLGVDNVNVTRYAGTLMIRRTYVLHGRTTA